MAISPDPLNVDWQRFLAGLGAHSEHGQVLHFGRLEVERQSVINADVLADLSHQALIRVQGPDAETFLQGQFTNDIRQATATRAQLSAYCNPKGRMFAVFLVTKRQDDYLLHLPAALAEGTLKRLRLFVMRAKVKLELAAPELVATGLSGPNAATLLQTATGIELQVPYDSTTQDELTVIRLPGPHPRFEFIGHAERQQTLWQQLLAGGAAPVGAGPWAWLDILAGIPIVLPETVEEFVPQMGNLEVVGGVSFTKGCYPGQEIVARMHYLGRLKQRMFLFHHGDDDLPLPGAPVFSPNFPDQSAGMVVSAQPSPQGGGDLLAIVQLSSIDSGEIHLGSPSGPQLILRTLPYTLPTVESK